MCKGAYEITCTFQASVQLLQYPKTQPKRYTQLQYRPLCMCRLLSHFKSTQKNNPQGYRHMIWSYASTVTTVDQHSCVVLGTSLVVDLMQALFPLLVQYNGLRLSDPIEREVRIICRLQLIDYVYFGCIKLFSWFVLFHARMFDWTRLSTKPLHLPQNSFILGLIQAWSTMLSKLDLMTWRWQKRQRFVEVIGRQPKGWVHQLLYLILKVLFSMIQRLETIKQYLYHVILCYMFLNIHKAYRNVSLSFIERISMVLLPWVLTSTMRFPGQHNAPEACLNIFSSYVQFQSLTLTF